MRAIDIRLLRKKRTGDETVFFNLTKELLAIDKEHQYLLLTDENNPQEIALIQARLGCVGQKNVQFVSLIGKNRFVWNLISVPWFLLTNKVDTYHTQYILPFLVPQRTKVLLHIHDVSFRAYPKLIGWKDLFFLDFFIPRSLARAERILVPSQFTKDEIVDYYGVAPEKIVVISNALGEDFLVSGNDVSPLLVQKKYHLPEDFIVYIGTLQPRKNIPFLIRAFAELRKRLPQMSLVLVGDREGHHVDSGIERALEETGVAESVCFPGYIDEHDLKGMLQSSSLFVFPSLYEGFGIPLLEAMSQEVPVAASDIPVLHEVAGEAAAYFDNTSIASCEEKLYTLCTDREQRARGISLGKSRLSYFSWKKSAKTLLALYETLV